MGAMPRLQEVDLSFVTVVLPDARSGTCTGVAFGESDTLVDELLKAVNVVGPKLRVLKLNGLNLKRKPMEWLVQQAQTWPVLENLELTRCYCNNDLEAELSTLRVRRGSVVLHDHVALHCDHRSAFEQHFAPGSAEATEAMQWMM